MYCVYKHTSPNGKVYIGITSNNPLYRWNNGNGYNHNKHFLNSIKKYGWDNFKHEILFEELTKEEAEKRECELIAFYKSNTFEHGYNQDSGGSCNKKHSKETKEKIGKSNSIALKGHKLSNETIEKLKIAHTGKKRSAETKAKISNANKGKKRSLEQIKNMSERVSGEKHPNYGKHLSDSTKEKIGKAHAKQVLQIDSNGMIVSQYNSAVEAAKHLHLPNGANKNICACANGKKKSAYGYKWSYVA